MQRNTVMMAVAALALIGVVLFFIGGTWANIVGLVFVAIAIVLAVLGNR
ncbi:hypothetical protein ACXZ66_12840 [Corynebacterium sp. S7]